MLLVLPFCARDVALVSTLLDYIQPLGPYDGHQALLLYPPDCEESLPELEAKAKNSFETVTSHCADRHADGWPAGPNSMFQAAASYVAGSPGQGPWYFFEPDNTPTGPGWMDALLAEYYDAHKPFMGAVVPTRVMRQGTEVIDGQHMVGTGIYPKNAADLLLFDTLRSTTAPFDVYLQWEIGPQCHETNLIQHVWNTKNCAWRGRSIIAKPANEIARQAQIKHKQAVVVHGVKDGSLMRLLGKENQLREAA
jgi:hypothetical protein